MMYNFVFLVLLITASDAARVKRRLLENFLCNGISLGGNGYHNYEYCVKHCNGLDTYETIRRDGGYTTKMCMKKLDFVVCRDACLAAWNAPPFETCRLQCGAAPRAAGWSD